MKSQAIRVANVVCLLNKETILRIFTKDPKEKNIMCISFITYPLSVFDKILSKITVLLVRYKKSREMKYFIRTVTLVNDMFFSYP